MSDVHRITDRQRLDRVLTDGAQDISPVTRAQVAAFEALLARKRRPGSRASSLRDEIEQLVMPEIADATIFQAGRPRALLQYVLDEVLHRLGDDDVVAVAGALLEEEIARQDDIAERLAAEAFP